LDQEIQSDRPLRDLGLRVYLPSFLFCIGEGAILSLIALGAKDVGASTAVAGLVVALRGIGVLACDVPAGWIVVRLGERTAILLASTLYAGTLVAWIFVESVPLFALLAFIQGSGWSIWQLARMAYISDVVPPHLLGRASSILGGVLRAGLFAGPFAGAGLAAIGGFAPVWAMAACTSMGAAALLFRYSSASEGRSARGVPAKFGVLLREHAVSFRTAAVAAGGVSGLRAAKIALLPLWADHIGLSTSTASLLVGLTVGVELLIVYPGGTIMDRVGRKAVIVPAMALMSAGLVLMPLAHHVWSLCLVGVVIGVGNGLSSGIVMTLGIDLSPKHARAEFLSLWRVVSDSGTALGPLVVSAATVAVTLGGASVVSGGIGLIGALAVVRYVPETGTPNGGGPPGGPISRSLDRWRSPARRPSR